MKMVDFLQQVYALLTTDTGSLAYQLVLAFSIAGALQLSLGQKDLRESPQVRRTVLGLSLLLVFRLSLFVGAGLAWQGIIDGGAWLPLMTRAVDLISLVLIVWLWAFPDPSPAADTATLLLGLLTLTVVVLTAVWWLQTDPNLDYNDSWPDFIAQITAVLIILLGSLYLLIRRPPGWGYGFAMLLLLMTGHLVQLIFAPHGGDYSGVVRLSQMMAYPLLLLLPQRLTTISMFSYQDAALAKASRDAEEVLQDKRPYADPKFLQSLLQLTKESTPDRVCYTISATLARIMAADISLLVLPPDENGVLTIQCGYDLINTRRIDNTSIEAHSVPVIASAFQVGRARRLPGSSTMPDLVGLAQLLNLDNSGSLLSVPVLSPDGSPILCVVLLSPYSDRKWTSEDQSYLALLSKPLVHFLQRSQEMTELQDQITQANQIARLAQDQAQQAFMERQKLRDQLVVVQDDAARDQNRLADLTEMIVAQTAAQAMITRLQEENQRLEEFAQQASETKATGQHGSQAELVLALEEIAVLRETLASAEAKIAANSQSQVAEPLSDAQTATILAIAQDLRQPLSSIMGYTDFLLSEEIGILGAKQRKHMERIRVSTERMGRLVDDLVQVTSPDSNLSHLDFEDVDLNSVVYDAIASTSTHLNQKDVVLQVDLPELMPLIRADQRALERILICLLQNAGSVTPQGGDIALRARFESSDDDEDYVLMQVADGGGGIGTDDLPRLFSPRAVQTTITGIGEDGTDLPKVKALVDALGGRIWVDSETGQGATYSVLLPVASANSDNGFDGGIL